MKFPARRYTHRPIIRQHNGRGALRAGKTSTLMGARPAFARCASHGGQAFRIRLSTSPAGKRQRSGKSFGTRPPSVCPPRKKSRGVKRRKALVRKPPHPVARLAVGPVPSTEGDRRSMTRTGAPCGASPRCSRGLGLTRSRAALSCPGYWRVHPVVQQAPCARVIVPVGRCPRRPGSPAGKPNPQANRPCLFQRCHPDGAPQQAG